METTRRAWSLRVAEGIGRRVATLEADLVRTQPVLELDEDLPVERHATRRLGIDLREPAFDSRRIELRVPRGVEPVREIDALAVAAPLDHLGPAVERTIDVLRVRGASLHPADVQAARQLGRRRIAHVVLPQLART